MARSSVLALLAAVALARLPPGAAAAGTAALGCAPGWRFVGSDTFRGAAAAIRS